MFLQRLKPEIMPHLVPCNFALSLSEIFFLCKEQFLSSYTQKESLYSILCHVVISVNQLSHPIFKPTFQFFLFFSQLPFPSSEKFILFLGITSEISHRNHHALLKAVAFHNTLTILQKQLHI